MTPRRDPLVSRWLEGVWIELGRNQIHERWIASREGWLGYQEPGRLVVSPLNMVQTIIHEALHAAHPHMTERGVARTTSRVWRSLTDNEARRIWETYSARVHRIAKPISSSDD